MKLLMEIVFIAEINQLVEHYIICNSNELHITFLCLNFYPQCCATQTYMYYENRVINTPSTLICNMPGTRIYNITV